MLATMQATLLIRTRLVRAGVAPLRRAGMLTPYLAQLIAEDVRRAGPHGRVEIRIETDCDETAVAEMRERFASLGGVRIVQRRSGEVRRVPHSPLAAASRPRAARAEIHILTLMLRRRCVPDGAAAGG
jgi:hypothetical protein